MTLKISSPKVYTMQGVPLSVTGIAQVILSLVAFVACEPESEAKPESESWYGFNYPSFYRGYSGYPYQYAYPTTYNYAMTARFAQPYNGHFVQPYRYFKREAEADSEADSEADAESWYYGYGFPSAFQQGYSGYPFYNMYQTAYSMPFNNARFVQQPYNGHFMRPYNYNRYYANSVGAVHVVKREAEADSEADAEASPESWYDGIYGQRYPMSVYPRYPTTTYSRYPTTTYSRYPSIYQFTRYPTSAYPTFANSRYAASPFSRFAWV